MNAKYIVALLVLVVSLTQCKKSPTEVEDPSNHSLLNKSINQIRAEIAGTWKLKRSYYEICGILGCTSKDTTYRNNDGDLFYFLANDTVKRTGYNGSPIKVYQKANILRKKYYGTFPVDSIYTYELSGGASEWLMVEVKNDTLIVEDVVYTYYLTR
jgi:hypothetical protein